MQKPRLKDFFELTSQKDTISQETKTIPIGSPYAINLDQLPQIRTGATSILGNVWLSVADATTLVTVEVETSPSTWQACTLTESPSPSALEVFFQLADPTIFPYSPRLIFNSARAGQDARVSYTGMGSVPLAQYYQRLFNLCELIQQSAPICMVDMEVYNFGRYDGGGTASKEVYATPSNVMIVGIDRSVLSFPGVMLDFDLGGNAEVSGFSTTLYWKRILVYIDVSGTTWTVSIVESAEQQLRTNLVTPAIDTSKTLLGYVDVQNSGTISVAGEISPIEFTNIQGMFFRANRDIGVISSNVSNPPTDAELDALFTSPATQGDGWTVYIDDSDSDNFYQIVASGSLWFIFTAAEAA